MLWSESFTASFDVGEQKKSGGKKGCERWGELV